MDDKKPYEKPFLSYEEQIELLEKRGLIIENKDKARHLLQKISYYRLSGYWYPLYADKENHIFKEKAKFESAFQLYCFDKHLRKLIFSELEKVEVAVRSAMIHIISEIHGAFWIQNEELFPNKEKYNSVMLKLMKEYERCDELFIDSFKNKYNDSVPPCWMVLEIASCGTLSSIYKELKPCRMKRKIANNFGLDEASFESWLHAIVYVRNLCAHHSRLWNRRFTIRPAILQVPKKLWITNKDVSNARLFYFVSAMVYLLNSINPNHKFREKFLTLIASYNSIDMRAMGFYEGWKEEELWQVQPTPAITPGIAIIDENCN